MFHVKHGAKEAEMKRQKKPPRIRRIIISGLFILIGVIILGLVITGFTISRITFVERTTLRLKDLPRDLEGKTILFVSDIDIMGLSGTSGTATLFEKLERLKPDMLILGGDYAGTSFIQKTVSDTDVTQMRMKRREFFKSLDDFNAPLGKYAVKGELDGNDLFDDLALGNIMLLDGNAARVNCGGGQLIIAGVGGGMGLAEDCTEIARATKSTDCVIAAAHSPASIAGLLTAEAGDSGAWCDVILTGHTLDGQAVIGGRTLIRLTEQEKRHGTGWSKESDTFVLVSPGLGCRGINFRLGTRSTVHLITLIRAEDPLEFPGG